MSSVKVYLRIRPGDPGSDDGSDSPDDLRGRSGSPESLFLKVLTNHNGKTCVIRSEKKHFNERKFEFEDIFEETASQPEVYSRFKDRLVESAINGVR
jgi:hypothetical protein